MKTRDKVILASTAAVWLLGLGLGLRSLWRFQVTAGARADAPRHWPVSSQLVRRPDRFTLVLAVHPQCPCTRASVQGLADVMRRLGGRLTAYVLVLRPREFPDDWARSDIWRSAERIPGVTVVEDVDGEQAALFQAQTSGQTLVYDRAGDMVFDGGLTAARGHAGPSLGQEQIVSLVDGRAAGPAVGHVFGCALGGRPGPERP